MSGYLISVCLTFIKLRRKIYREKMFDQKFNMMIAGMIACIMLIMSVFMSAAATDTNDIPVQYLKPDFAWGEKTNEIRAGLFWNDEVDSGIKSQDVVVLVLTSKAGVEQDYVKPPNGKFAKFELQDSNGKVITPLRGKELDGKLPQTIQSKDLPRTPEFGRNAPILIGKLPLFQNHAWPLKEFHIQDSYQIKDEGDYTMICWPAIYHFPANSQFVARVDLPPVSMKIHLTSSPDK